MGLLKTIEESLKGQPDPLPIDSWWLIGHDRFEVITLISKQLATMLVATPRPGGATPTAIWSADAEGYTTGRLGIVTRRALICVPAELRPGAPTPGATFA
jgi:hypothetical protein